MVLKELIFDTFVLWDGVVALKELIFNNFCLGRVLWSGRNSFVTFSVLGWCDGL